MWPYINRKILTVVIKTVLLQQVYDAELVGDAGNDVLDPEVKPLRVPLCVEVSLQHQLVLELTPLSNNIHRIIRQRSCIHPLTDSEMHQWCELLCVI